VFCEVVHYSCVKYAAEHFPKVTVDTDAPVVVWDTFITLLIYGGDESFVPGVREVAYIYYHIEKF